MTHERSQAAFERARRVISGGVNSTVRAFGAVGGTPIFVKSASGCTFTDLDDNTYIDYVMSWGPLILGHAYPPVIEAVRNAALLGTSYGAPTQVESELAELIIALMPSIDAVRFCSSGTEATMHALRLARGFTKREKVIKFAGCYHGCADPFLVSAGSSALSIGVSDSAGITEGTLRDTIVVPYNDLDAVREIVRTHARDIAAIIVEPYAGNMGLVLPRPGFLSGLRELTQAHGTLLIFDEVMTGFRVAPGGAQERTGIAPDITTLGKIVGGGLPVGAVGGRRDIMAHFTPLGNVFQAGTLSGNPLAMSAGIATLRALQTIPGAYNELERLGARFTEGMRAIFSRHGIPHQTAQVGSMVGFFLTPQPVTDLTSAKTTNTRLYARFFHALLERGVYLAPSPFEASFLSLGHADSAIDATLAAVNEVAPTLNDRA